MRRWCQIEVIKSIGLFNRVHVIVSLYVGLSVIQSVLKITGNNWDVKTVSVMEAINYDL